MAKTTTFVTHSSDLHSRLDYDLETWLALHARPSEQESTLEYFEPLTGTSTGTGDVDFGGVTWSCTLKLADDVGIYASRAFAGMLAIAVTSQGVTETSPSVDQLVQELREQAGLTGSQVAALLGVSRRTLYHWLSRGGISEPNRERLQQVHRALRPLVATWKPIHVKSWLFAGEPAPDELIRENRFSDLANAVEQAVEQSAIPVLEGRLVGIDEDHAAAMADSSPTRAEVLSALKVFGAPRHVRAEQRWTPPELADSLPSEG